MQNLIELLRELRLSFPTAIVLIVFFLVGQSALDRFGEYLTKRQQSAIDRASFVRFVHDSCLPRTPSQRAIAKINPDNKLACNIYDNLDYGMAATVVSAAVMEQPQ